MGTGRLDGQHLLVVTNLLGAGLITRFALPHLEATAGRAVYISSTTAGLFPPLRVSPCTPPSRSNPHLLEPNSALSRRWTALGDISTSKELTMTKAVLVVFTNVTSPEHDDAYNDWYDNTHLGDVVKVPGFLAATRYRLADTQAAGVEPRHRYLSIYEVESDDLRGTLDSLRLAGREMVMSEHLDGGRSTAYLYEEITPRVTCAAQ
jgi:hypothetical protein